MGRYLEGAVELRGVVLYSNDDGHGESNSVLVSG